MKATTKVFLLSITLLLLLCRAEATPAAAQSGPPVLAFYYAWFDQGTWSSGQMVDVPAEPYSSADPGTMARHVAQARSAGIDGLVQSWYGPSENPTETNFKTLLAVAQPQGLQAAVDVEVTGPFFGDAGSVTSALQTLLATHAQHPAYLRYQGKPVIFFWRQQRFSVGEWTAIRSQVDPGNNSYWIAEGTDIAYQAVFDGHHLYSIAWAGSPADQLQKWSGRVRSYATDHQIQRLWVATTMPGYDDTRLPRADAFAVPRRGGDYYRETWQGALASGPDMVIITSFNEWLEGTQIEPSASYGNLYLDVTRELVTALRGSPPPQVAVVQPAAQTEPPAEATVTPSSPYVTVESSTNVRSGPATTFDRVGQLPAGGSAAVVGRTEAGDWWQIEFAAGPEGRGWVSAEVVEFGGDGAAVPVVEAPTPAATETVTAAAAPTLAAAGETTPPATGGAATSQPARTPTPMETPGQEMPQVSAPAGGVNVRSGPGLNFELLGRLEENEPARVTGVNETGEWWQIEYRAGENGLGWVADAVIDFQGNQAGVPVVDYRGTAETPTPTPTEPIIAGQIEARDAINVRGEPSVEGEVLGGLYLGDKADVLAVSEDGEWWLIDFPEGPEGRGWVSAEFARFQGDRAAVSIYGQGTPTPTPGPTDTPTATPSRPTPTPLTQPTFAPTATSVYEATSAAVLAERGTPALEQNGPAGRTGFSLYWSDVPWGLLAVLVVALLVWFQFYYRRRFR